MADTSLGQLMAEVLETGESKKLDEVQQDSFFKSFYQKITPTIEKIREEQRQRFEDGRNLTLS